jgi:hypothetical protein
MKKIHITEAQLNALKKKLNELNLSGDENLNAANGNVTDATKTTLQNAKDDGVNVDNAGVTVGFSQSALKQNGVSEGKLFTKKQIKEAKLAKLRNECKKYTKKDLIKK